MNKEDKYSFEYAIGCSIQENKEKIEKLEKQNKRLRKRLKEKETIIDEAMEYFCEDCPYSVAWKDEEIEKIKKICNCNNCEENFKKCWLKYLKNEIKERKNK